MSELESADNVGDSNAVVMLPHKKKKTNTKSPGGKGSTKRTGRGQQPPPMSKSKQRKLKQLQDEKEKKTMLAKSIKILEKYKIQDDAYSLLLSSGTMGQVQTMREKRLRAVQFSKAGLAVPKDAHLSKRRKGEHVIIFDSEMTQKAFVDHDLVPYNLDSQDHAIGRHQDFLYECPPNDTSLASNPESVLPESTTKDVAACFPRNESNAAVILRCNNGEKESNHQDQMKSSISYDLQNATDSTYGIAPTVVHVLRPKEVEESRESLPIVMMEQEIMEAINENSFVIICGETGCGKTTQVPQFLYESGFGSNNCTARKGVIGITQPRRVAVLATAKRVSFELGLRLGREVGFQVRHDKMLGKNCSIKFMTDGILLRELQSDFLLKKYSIIILDEAHERSLNTDILIGMLSRVVQLRHTMYLEQQEQILSGTKIKTEDRISQLKLVLMSATLRVDDFISGSRLFPETPPIIEVPTRQYPVTIHFSKRTDEVDYVGQAYKKVLQIHKKLPPGGILVFVTGQREVEYLCKKLRKASSQLTKKIFKEKGNDKVSAVPEINTIDAFEAMEDGESSYQQNDIFNTFEQDMDDLNSDSNISESDNESEMLDSEDEDILMSEQLDKDDSLLKLINEPDSLASLKASFDTLLSSNPNQNSEGKSSPSAVLTLEESMQKNDASSGALNILPLYARLPAYCQLRVFENGREGDRLVVVATNVAETSLTIPGIKYVVDTGREKVRNYSHTTGMETYEIQWISKASAAQRAGRAGRTSPGHCYRLYSSAAFNNVFPEFSFPQITKVPVDGVVLLMKFMGINKVAKFPFPTPPETTAILEAERCLMAIEALDNKGRLTPTGKAMAQYPMSPRHSRMLLTVVKLLNMQKGFDRANLILGYAVSSAAALSFPSPFDIDLDENHGTIDGSVPDTNSDSKKHEKQKQKKVRAAVKEARARFSNPSSDALTISYALQSYELAENPVDFCRKNSLHYKTMYEMSKLRKQLLQLLFSKNDSNVDFGWGHGSIREVEHAWRIPSNKHPLWMNEEEILGQAICTGWADRVAKRIRRVAELSEIDRKAKAIQYQSCALSETVFLNRRSSVSQTAPEYLVYTELLRSKRPYMHGITAVKPEWLVKCASSLCNFSAPLTEPKPYYEPLSDNLFCWVNPTFGPHIWQLPLHGTPIKSEMLRISVFACALLEGNVLPCIKSVQKYLAASPSTILRPEASGQRRVGDLLYKLKSGPRVIDNRAVLQDIWKENPAALYTEIMSWFQEKFHDSMEELWARMQSEVALEAHELYPKLANRGKKSKRGKDCKVQRV